MSDKFAAVLFKCDEGYAEIIFEQLKKDPMVQLVYCRTSFKFLKVVQAGST